MYKPAQSFIRVATACPEVAVGDISANAKRIGALYDASVREKASLVVFPELSLTGYTLGDLVQHALVLDKAKQIVLELADKTRGGQTALLVGLPVRVGNGLYNCAAMLSDGNVRGIVPKTYLPGHDEFYDPRWFRSWRKKANAEVELGGRLVPFGTDLLFQIGRARVGVEICEDLWVPNPPSVKLAAAGATLIANPSASPEQVTKDTYRRQLVAMQSSRLIAAYVYAGCDSSESTTDIVMGGHQIIAENGRILQERVPFEAAKRLLIADVDLNRLLHDRRKNTNFSFRPAPVVDCAVRPVQTDLRRQIDPHPFIPAGPNAGQELERVLDIQAQGLATRMRQTGVEKLVIGLSGGLDSTLALLVAMRAAKRLGRPQSLIQTLTMPGEASSKATQTNAARLAKALGVKNRVIPIAPLARLQLKALGHDGVTQDVTYENVQARVRTSLLFNWANRIKGQVVGTGDLSEIALGWSTYNGDHMSHYNVNASIPKTLVRRLVGHAAEQSGGEVRELLRAVLDTPISPELTSAQAGGISQRTETLIGPYELHDFFLYQFIRGGDEPPKIAYLAERAFAGRYTPAEIKKWLDMFIGRFMGNQWKRSVATDGPKAGSVSLSPRGDFRMPSEMSGILWRDSLE